MTLLVSVVLHMREQMDDVVDVAGNLFYSRRQVVCRVLLEADGEDMPWVGAPASLQQVIGTLGQQLRFAGAWACDDQAIVHRPHSIFGVRFKADTLILWSAGSFSPWLPMLWRLPWSCDVLGSGTQQF